MQFSPKGGNEMAQVSSDDAKRAKSAGKTRCQAYVLCQPRVTSVHNILYVYNMTNSAQKQHIFSNMRIFQTCTNSLVNHQRSGG